MLPLPQHLPAFGHEAEAAGLLATSPSTLPEIAGPAAVLKPRYSGPKLARPHECHTHFRIHWTTLHTFRTPFHCPREAGRFRTAEAGRLATLAGRFVLVLAASLRAAFCGFSTAAFCGCSGTETAGAAVEGSAVGGTLMFTTKFNLPVSLACCGPCPSRLWPRR